MKIKEFIDDYTSRYSTIISAIMAMLAVSFTLFYFFEGGTTTGAILHQSIWYESLVNSYVYAICFLLIIIPTFILILLYPTVLLLNYKNIKQLIHRLLLTTGIFIIYFYIEMWLSTPIFIFIAGCFLYKFGAIHLYLLTYVIICYLETRKNFRLKNDSFIHSKIYKYSVLIFNFLFITELISAMIIMYNIWKDTY